MIKTALIFSTFLFSICASAADLCALKVTTGEITLRDEYRNLAVPSIEAVLAAKGYQISQEDDEALSLQLTWNYFGDNNLMEWTSEAAIVLSFRADSRSAFAQLIPTAPREFMTNIFSESDSRPDEATAAAAIEVLGRLANKLPTCLEARKSLIEAKREFFSRYKNN